MIIRLGLLIILLINMTWETTMNQKKMLPMSFPRRRQFDELFRRLTRQCEQKDACQIFIPKTSFQIEIAIQELADINMINCIRQCISSLCYRNIYEKDSLERGEIDTRANLFKICWIKEQKEWK